MRGWQRVTLHVLSATVAVTGLLYLWMKYGIESEDPFAIVNHPWQAFTLKVHLLAAPLLVFMLGWVFESHIQHKLSRRESLNRKSGLIALASFGLMVLSGYGLQLTAHPLWLGVIRWLHIGTGCLFSGAYLIHLVISLRALRRLSKPGRMHRLAA